MRHKFLIFVIAVIGGAASCWGQSSLPAKSALKPRSTSAAKTTLVGAPALNITQLSSTLAGLEQLTRQTTLDLARLRIDKWKTDGNTKDQIQSNAQSLMSNMTNALPGMISAARSAPTSLSANLRLYRDLNVLYEVLSPLADSAGAFGSKDEYQILSTDTQLLEANRHSLANYMESLAAFQDAELARLRGRSSQTASPVASSGKATPAPTPAHTGPVIIVGANGVPKRIVDAGDDSDTARKPVHKKTPSSTAQPTPQGTAKSQ
jgi:hypothetical protein